MVSKTGNLFTLDFGREPYEMIPRTVLMDDLVHTLLEDQPSRHINMVIRKRS